MDSDISWQLLRGIVRDWAGASAELAEVSPLRGGAIHTVLLLTTSDGAKAVLKITPHRVDRAYQDEAYQLNLLRSLGLPTPEVYACHLGMLDTPHSYLLLQFLPGVAFSEAKRQCSAEQFDHLQVDLAACVLRMHAQKSSHYWRVTADPLRHEHEHWPRFYREMYDPIWREVEKLADLPVKPKRLIAKIHDRLDDLLAHDDSPRLVHWDLWSGNVLASPDGAGKWRINAILDPNCKFAHAEAELAYLDLFHTTTPAFFRAYQQSGKLSADYHRIRKLVYQLYPLIDDVTLHGPQYLKPLLTQLEKLAVLF